MRRRLSSKPLLNKKGSRLLPFSTHSTRLSGSDFKQHDDRDDGADQNQGTRLDRGIQSAIPAGSTFSELFHNYSPTQRYMRTY